MLILTNQPKKRIQSKKKAPGLGLYLGKPIERERRIKELNALAAEHGAESLSQLLQWLADGMIKLCKD